MDHSADWWLGSLDDPWFRALESAVRDEWGVAPLRIREGGVSFIIARAKGFVSDFSLAVDTLGAMAGERVWLPCSASAHGPRLGKSVLPDFRSFGNTGYGG